MLIHRVYTVHLTPFGLGGISEEVATELLGYPEEVDLGRGYKGLLVRNPRIELWYIFESESGALIGTARYRQDVLDRVRADVATGDPAIMRSQIADGKVRNARARTISPEDFFRSFAGRPRKEPVRPGRKRGRK